MSSNLICIDCSNNTTQFSSVPELEAHIASDHLSIYAYECERCRFAKFPTEYALISHCKNDHGLTEFSIKYRYSKELENLKEKLAEKVRKCVKNWISGPKNREDDNIFPANFIKQEENQILGPPIPPISPSLNQASFVSTMMDYYAHMDDNIRSDHTSNNTQEGGEKKKKILIQCVLCGESVAKQRSSMMYHANTRHSKYDLYQCNVCGKIWQTIAKSDVLKHIKTHHESPDGIIDDSIITDFRKERSNDLRQITAKCFPENKSKIIIMKGTSPRNTDETIEDDDFQIEEV